MISQNNALVTFSIITPTVGRDTFWAALDCVQEQMLLGDEHLIWMDFMDEDFRKKLLNRPDVQRRIYAGPRMSGGLGRFGNPGRDILLNLDPRGTHIIYLDDDDLLMPNALAEIRKCVSMDPTIPHMFCAEQKSSGIVLRAFESATGNYEKYTVCGSQLVAPNYRPPPVWDHPDEDPYTREVAVIKQVLERSGGKHMWHDGVFTHAIGPASLGRRPERYS